ncbi:MAG: helix-turn-helix domain-containing protein [Luteitalea sp.]|nr:helix-turn-helix domain-containing protein [Luteitalea sp.]
MQEKLRAVRLRVGERIRQLRNFRGLSQEQLAEQVGNTPVHMGLVERGKANVTIDILTMIADKLSVDVAELVVPAPGLAPGEHTHIATQHDLEDIMQVVRRIKRGGGRRMRETQDRPTIGRRVSVTRPTK